jgi:hypothetical protein
MDYANKTARSMHFCWSIRLGVFYLGIVRLGAYLIRMDRAVRHLSPHIRGVSFRLDRLSRESLGEEHPREDPESQ